MKWFASWAIASALVVLVSPARGAEYRSQPVICVALDQKDLGSNITQISAKDGESVCTGGAGGLCACGSSSDNKGSNGFSGSFPTYAASYTVVSTRPGHFSVEASYLIESGGISRNYVRTLSVLEKAPNRSHWSSVGREFSAVAYLSATAVR